jgi:hypothetical protein
MPCETTLPPESHVYDEERIAKGCQSSLEGIASGCEKGWCRNQLKYCIIYLANGNEGDLSF